MTNNHPSYRTDIGCVEHDISVAIHQSAIMGGQSVGIAYSDEAARLLSEECDLESETEYSYSGVTGEHDGERPWRVHLCD